ncbi:MAG TPA: hypothetical protein PLI53_06190 [Geobacteraceae bacterium]|nr:hypothetical protein [Geobacteraceae bacterium]
MAVAKKNLLSVIAGILSILILVGCSSSCKDVKGRNFEVSSLVKNDIDLVTETHQRVVFAALRELAVKLYKRNPREWKKERNESLEVAVAVLSGDPFPSVEGKTSIDCIRLAFDEEFHGDRVKAFVSGLETMVLNSYDGHRDFYLYNMLDAQKLYDSARNIELASWLIRTKRDSTDTLFLLSANEGDKMSLGIERLFGKMINAQDMMAQIMADRSNRTIKNVLQSLVTAFIPI